MASCRAVRIRQPRPNHVDTENSSESGGHPGRPGRGARLGRSRPDVRLAGRRRDVRQLPLLQPIRILRQHLRVLRRRLPEPVQRLQPRPEVRLAVRRRQVRGLPLLQPVRLLRRHPRVLRRRLPEPVQRLRPTSPSPRAQRRGRGVYLVQGPLRAAPPLHRNDAACTARGFYTYEAFLAAAAAFPAFGGTTEGLSVETRKREVAAFLGQTSHETTGGWSTAPDGPFSWGYCFKQEREPKSIYCDTTKPEWPCAPGKEYIGRGPIQLTWNYNYGQAGRALSLDLLNNPDLVAADAVVSFKTALWFWMTPQGNKPSSHAVITGRWTPTAADTAAGRVPEYGVITNIVNGGLECGIGPDPRVADRIGFYQRYCGILGVTTGSNLDCYNQRPFSASVSSAGLAEQ
ncbi:hypothetical protein ACQ4PT_010299 [Festuca glaucescens]